MDSIRKLPTQSLVNCRDLGGYAVPGGATRFGRVLRCGVPKSLCTQDIELLREYGIKSIIDLRGNGEAAEMPSEFPDAGFDYYHVSLFEANPTILSEVKDMSDLYLMSIEKYRENLREIFSLIAGIEGQFLVHCFLGKDRTGVLCALLLAASGVSREDIIADYVLSEVYLKPFYKCEIQNETDLLWETDMTKLGSPARNIERVLNAIERDFGGINGYLSSIGVTAEQYSKLKNVLI